MAISGKDVQVWMWRIVKFSMRSAYTLVKNHPFLSFPLLFFLVLYICFPSYFWISLYSSVFLVFVILGTRIYVRQRNANSFRKDDEKKSDAGAVRKDGSAENEGTKIGLDKSLTRARSVRRRKSKETSRDSSVHTSEDEKNTIFTSSFNNDLIDKSALTEEKPKEIEVDSVISRHAAECCSSSSNEPCLVLRPEIHHHDDEGSRKFGGDVEVESSEGTDEEDEQEREANKKAVQWTETDQKNLMDLGFSEIERNKRLESLIARRRARKLLSLQVRRPVINIDSFETHGPMTTLMIPRGNSNPFLASQSVGNYSPMPGSAPSVLLPNQNPFDLPYDPQEERPNLTGGSFHQEFQDITFTRPENVGLRPLSPSSRELKEDQQQEEASLPHDLTKEGGFSEGLENSKVEGQLDEKDTDKIIEVESCQEPKCELEVDTTDKVIKEQVPDFKQETSLVSDSEEEKGRKVETKSVLIKDSIAKLSSPSSSEDDVPIYRVDKEAVLKALVRNMSLHKDGNCQMGYAGNSYDPSSVNMNKMHELVCNADRDLHHNHHTSMSSIASDLQVEVSEVSWSGLTETDDGGISSPDEEISSYKGDVESESFGGNEDIRGPSSQLPRIEENEPKEVYDANEDSTIDVGFSRNKESENHVSHQFEEQMIGHNDESILSPDEVFSAYIQQKKEVFSAYKGEIENASIDGNEGIEGTPKEEFHANKDDAEPVGFSRTRESENHHVSREPGDEVIEHSATDSLSLSASKAESPDQIQDCCSSDLSHAPLESDTLSSPVMDKMQQFEGKSQNDYTESQPEKIEEHHNTLELDGSNLKDTELDKLDSSMPIDENNTTTESIQVDEGKEHGSEVKSSGAHPSFSDRQVRALLPASVLEQFHIDSNASSPRSVLHRDISIDPSPYSNSGANMHVEIQQFHPQRVENSGLDEARGEGLAYTLPQSTMLLMVDSRSHPLNEESVDISQESSSPSKFNEEANSIREDMVHGNEERVNETNDVLEGSSGGQESGNLSIISTDKANSGSASEDMVLENEIREDKTSSIHEHNSEKRQESSNLSTSIKEDNLSRPLSQDIVHENEMNVIPDVGEKSVSTEKQVIHEDEKNQHETKDVSEGVSNSTKSTEESNSSLPVFPSDEEAISIRTESERSRQNETKLSPESKETVSKGIEEEISFGLPHNGEESSNLSASPEEANLMKFANNEKGQNEAKDISDERLQGFSIPDASTEEISSKSLIEAENEVNKSNSPIMIREEISQFQENPIGVAYKEEQALNSVHDQAQPSTTTSKDSQVPSGSAIPSPKEEINIELEQSKSTEEGNIAKNHTFTTQTEVTTNDSEGRRSNEEVINGNPSLEKSLVSQMNKDETGKEVHQV